MTDQARQEAILPLAELVANDPTTALYLPLAERLRERGRLDEAIRLCEERRLRPGTGVGDRIVLGRAYLADGRLADARAEFHAALSLDRENVVALKALAGILSHLGDHAEAASYYRAVCRVDPGDLESQTALHQITSGEYPEVRPPDVVVDQGDLGWQPVRLPREEEHISELALGLHTIERFDAVRPAPYRAVIQDFQDVPLERAVAAEPAHAPEAARVEPDLAVEPISAVGDVAPDAGAAATRPDAVTPAPAPSAAPFAPGPVVAGNRSAFEQWLRRIGGKDQ
jgi:tetratricopeptide (TPR) repeat protein